MTFSFIILTTGIFRMAEECAGHLVFIFIMAGSFKEDKECAGHLVFLFSLTGYRSCRQRVNKKPSNIVLPIKKITSTI